VALNAVTVLGVLAFGWPAGNVFVLFWVENAVIGAWSVVRILTARGTGGGGRTTIKINGRRTNAGPGALALFFCVHYGLFCLVHAVFSGYVAYTLGVDPTFLFLGLPIVLIMVRYTVETVTVWFGAGQRDVVSPAQAMAQPYPRIVVLHVTVLIAFAVVLHGQTQAAGSTGGGSLAQLPLVSWLEDRLGQDVWLVLLLIIFKTVADVWTTSRATRIRPA
jgi:hypothetical protein